MDHTIDIHGADSAVSRFLEQWTDPNDWIEVQTSGSTGAPKRIRLPKRDMEESARATCRFFDIGQHSHLVMPLSADYIAGKMMVVRALVSGARLTVLPPSRSLSSLTSNLGVIDLLPIVPAQVEGLLASEALKQVGNVIVGGAPLTPAQTQALVDSGINAYATYGMTETCSHVALKHIGHADAYESMPGIEFDTDSEGALVILAPAYTFGRLVTNDMVRRIDRHHFVWLGRRDNVINSGGIKIMPEHVEDILRPYLGELEFYISSRPSPRWGQELVLVVTADAPDLSDALVKAAREIPHHLLPKSIIRVAHLRHTHTGKLIRESF